MGIIWLFIGISAACRLGGGSWVTLGSGLTSVNGLDGDPYYSSTYPQLVQAMYQGAFAVITPALISGGVVGRIKFWPYMIFLLVWSTVCYDALAHWMWSADGWLGYNPNGGLGAIDFAGGTVVHISSGTSALTAAYVLGKRLGIDIHNQRPANVPFVMLGCTFLWIGWAGFNAGSANSASGLAGLALVNTNVAAAAACMTWIFLEAGLRGKPTLVGGCIGAVVGLVAITPAAGFVQPGWAILIGILGSAGVYGSLRVKHWLRADDTLDVFISHGIGGIIGSLLTGCFAQTAWNSAGPNGAFYGNGMQLAYQTAAICVTLAYASGCTAVIMLLLHYTIGIRIDGERELMGLDEAIHGESHFIFSMQDLTKEGATPYQLDIRDVGSDNGKGMPSTELTPHPEHDHRHDIDKHNNNKFNSLTVDTGVPPVVQRVASASQTRPTTRIRGGDSLSQAVAELVSQLALPGHSYDIGISRSC